MKLVLGKYIKVAICCGGLFWCGKWASFCCWAGFCPHLKGFPQGFGVRGREIHTWWGQQPWLKERNIFGKIANMGGTIKGDNSAEHCFVLRDFIPMNLFSPPILLNIVTIARNHT